MLETADLFTQLNDYQKEAVLDDSPAFMLNAHVGSGKTTVLISKVLYLSLEKNVDLEDMVVLTFTNKAADEIKERLMRVKPDLEEKDMPYVGTFHSVASKLLRNVLPVEELGYTSDFSIMEPDEVEDMANRLIIEHGFDIKYKNKLILRLGHVKNGRTLFGNMRREDDIVTLWEKLNEEKKAQNKMDFDDLILNATTLLAEHPIHPKWIIIDEFQDSDPTQLEFIKAMTSPNTKLFVVGDPNQVIYSWRGSDSNIFEKFKAEFDAKAMSLPINYRSSSTILEVANHFLSDEPDLEGIRQEGSKIIIKNHYDAFNEAQYIADRIKSLRKEGLNYSDIAVFYRLQRQARPLEDVFQREQIPFEVSLKKSLKDFPVLHWFVHLLKASLNEKDKNNVIATLHNKKFGEGLTLNRIKKIIDGEETSLLYEKMKRFPDWCKQHTIADLLDIYDYFDLDDYLMPTSAEYMENKNLIIDFLTAMQIDFEKNERELATGIMEYVNSSTLHGLEFLEDDYDVEEDRVKLMTLHACKGLEFKKVFIVGVNDGLIPIRTKPEEEYEEEKRLFFVGITRAKDELELSYYSFPDDHWVDRGPSHFISMIPKHLIAEEEKESDFGEVGLADIRRQIIENREKQSGAEAADLFVDEPSATTEERDDRQRVRHEKYGEGVIESEENGFIIVNFDDYGTKKFAKMFVELEYF